LNRSKILTEFKLCLGDRCRLINLPPLYVLFTPSDLLFRLSDVGDSDSFIYRFLVKRKNLDIPADSSKLRISQKSFRFVLEHFDLSPSFISAFTQLHLPSGRGFIPATPALKCTKVKLWYVLPVRVQVACSDKAKGHASSTSGSNQMDPFHYLHLSEAEVDIRGSHIAVASEYALGGTNSKTVSFNFMDGRWSKSVEEPENRLLEALHHAEKLQSNEDPFFIHTIYFSSGIRWFMNALSSVNAQLIAFEKELQKQIDEQMAEKSASYNMINRALHSIAAHLHRYGTELGATQNILKDLMAAHAQYQSTCINDESFSGATTAFKFVESQLNETCVFLQELEVKLQNILALVSL